MKILLISSNLASTPYSVYPLGLSMIAAALTKAGHNVRQFDFLHANRSPDAVANQITEYKPDIIGISIRNIDNANMLNPQKYIDAVKSITDIIRQHTRARVVLGGSGFSIMPELILEKVGADYGIVGEGESLMVDLVQNLEKGKHPDKKCLYASLELTGKQIPSAQYDSEIMKFYLKKGSIGSVQTKRGCPHKCIYCAYPIIEGPRIRCRDPREVVYDIKTLIHDHNAQHIFFTDSVFNDDKGYYIDVVIKMKQEEISIPWTAYFKPTGLTGQAIGLMKETGLAAAEVGADASTDKTLRKLGKSFKFKDIMKNNQLFAEHNIASAQFYIFGGPGETEDTVLEGIENIKSIEKTVSLMFMGIRILPCTIIAEIAQQQNIISKDEQLLEPVYYISPEVDKDWMEHILTNAFNKSKRCIFPPDRLDDNLKFLHNMGYSGSLWEMLLLRKKRKKTTEPGAEIGDRGRTT
jgi:lipid biosynthesis B12-binding/radical SAM protein